MQIHGPGGVAALENVTLNPGITGKPFAIIEFTLGMSVFVYSAAECDALIKAAVTAKDLLLTAQAQATANGMVAAGVARNEAAAAAELAPVLPHCGEVYPATALQCTLPAGHRGFHEASGPDGEMYKAWPALAPPAPYSLPALTQEGR
jgi:hypothetical protein